MTVLHGVLGLLALIVVAWLLSERRDLFPWRTTVAGLLIQLALAALLLKLPLFKEFFVVLNEGLLSLQQATQAGTSFVFGYLGGGAPPYEESGPGTSFVLAFQALPLILVVSALSSLLFYWRILPRVVQVFAWLLRKSMGIGGALGFGAAANIFVGMVEAPLFVRPYLQRMGRSELFALMTTGMATIAGTMMVLYGSLLGQTTPDAMGHILSASIISAPAAILISAVMIPMQGDATEGGYVPPRVANGAMDAVTRGTLQGVELLINIVAMLVVLVGLVSLVNIILGLLPHVGGEAVTLQRILGYVMAPLVWIMGVPAPEALTAGSLMGTKTVLNEFIAYVDLSSLPDDALSARSRIMMIYALCGFANLGSLGIMIGGMGTMVPERRAEIVSLGFRSIVAGTLATLMTGTVVGLLI
jgi:CNT family concentrative nucleoside transporter